ncbi:MAG: pyridoxal phosphate-dependent aminotransferase [Methanobacteriota archaeon]|nr:MAG: pyridoxal phosphate-dependent aminotransferase [Euryarchaeota archaeon]
MFAKRMSFIEPSGTLELLKTVKKLRAKGKKVISFGIGEMDLPTPKHVVTAAKKALDQGLTRYGPPKGLPELREAIVKRSREVNGIRCGIENVMITPTKFAIYLSCVALLNNGDEVLIPDPYWVSYADMVYAAGGRPKFYKLKSSYFRPDEEELKRLVTKKTKMMMLNTPSNPAGSVFPRESLKMVADFAIENDLFVVSDEIYERQVFEGKHISVTTMRGMARRTITVNGFSKTYAMTGWRLGWMIAPTLIIDAIGRLQEHTITCLPAFVQKGGVAALTGSQKFIRDMQRDLNKKRKLIVKGLNSIEGLECTAPEGTFYVFPKYDFDMKSEDLAQKILKKGEVVVVPGRVFGRAGEGYFRMAFAKEVDTIEEGLGKLELALKKIRR